MSLIFSLFAFVQSTGVPWKVLIVAGLILATGIALIVYFFRRLRGSEAEPEEDWSLSRRSLLGSADTLKPAEASRTPEPATADARQVMEPAAIDLPAAHHKAEQQVAEHAPVPGPTAATPEPRIPSRPVEAAAEHIAPASPPPAPSTVPGPPIADRPHAAHPPGGVPSIGAHTIAPPGVTEEEFHESLQHSPIGEEIWTDLEKHPAPRADGEARVVSHTGRREPFEPPRIEPLAPRERPGPLGGGTAAMDVPGGPTPPKPEPSVSSTAKEMRRAWADQEVPRLVDRPAIRPEVSQIAGRAGAKQQAGSILGLPAGATAGPLVLGEVRHSADESSIGTLSNYGKEADDGGGHSGTIALLVVILIVGGVLLAYLFVPGVHSSINGMISRARGINPEDEVPKAQIFNATYDPSKTPTEATGTVQNISQQTLTGLSVEVKLERRGGGSELKSVPVNPSEIAPGAQGTFQFELDGKQYARYGVNRLVARNGSDVKFVKPNQETQPQTKSQ
jgi:hypothetical protein